MNIRKALSVLLVLLLALTCCMAFVACGETACEHADNNGDGKCDKCDAETGNPPTACTEHNDANSDGECDNCGATVETPPEADGTVTLVEGGIPKFQIVVGSDAAKSHAADINSLIGKLNDRLEGEDLVYLTEQESTEQHIEILIGTVTTRGNEYTVDKYTYGYDGYAVKIVGTKVLVIGGSDKALGDALKDLEKEIFGIKNKVNPIKNITMTESIDKPQTAFTVNTINIDSTDIKEYVIATDLEDTDFKTLAETAQSSLYMGSGRYLDIVSVHSLADGQKAVIFRTIPNGGEGTTQEGFHVYVADNGNLIVEGEFPNKYFENAESFIKNDVAFASKKTVNLEGDIKKVNVRDIRYSEFGAKGDGIANDFFAIKRAHEYANEWGHDVYADSGKTYYIGNQTDGDVCESIKIKTNVYWGDATFIIDDTIIDISDPERGTDIFTIVPDNAGTTITPKTEGVGGELLKALNSKDGVAIDKTDFTSFDLGLGYKAMVLIYNENHKNYIRYGPNASSGTSQMELAIINADGSVDQSTPLLFDYDEITSVTVINIDDKPITVSGGVFQTKANQSTLRNYYYYSRGITVSRSNTIIEGFKHFITDEGDSGEPYSHFISVDCCNNVFVQDGEIQAHKVYQKYNDPSNSMGTYEFTAYGANNVTWKNIRQSNFFVDVEVNGKMYEVPSIGNGWWGAMGSNNSKNLTYDTCRITRFDAHQGTYNGTIINSEVSAIELIGGGMMHIENTKIYKDFASTSTTVCNLRADYGSTWNGDLVIKDCTLVVNNPNSVNQICLFGAEWYDHYFGYQCYLFQNITLDNFKIDTKGNGKIDHIVLARGSATLTGTSTSEKNPLIGVKTWNITNCEGLKFNIPDGDAFKQTKLIIEGEEQKK